MDRRIEKAIELLRQHRGRKHLTSSELAKRVNLSTSRLYDLFKTETNTSPASYAKTERMKTSKALLETSFLSIKEIAERAGFGDVSHFVHDFKKHLGLTPTEYRKRNSKS